MDPINTIPVEQFIKKVKSADASRSRDVKLDIQEAKKLAFTLGEVMTRLNGDLEKLIITAKSTEDETIQVQLDGGNNW